ncbi:unnamed protein product, partial [Strongylus vulgaris]
MSKTVDPEITEEDLQYIEENGLELSSNTEDSDQPRILLGCDYLWEVMDSDKHKLPSGMHLISTKMDTREAAESLLESLNEKTKSMFEEPEIQRRLDIVYADITVLLSRSEDCQQKLEFLKQK